MKSIAMALTTIAALTLAAPASAETVSRDGLMQLAQADVRVRVNERGPRVVVRERHRHVHRAPVRKRVIVHERRPASKTVIIKKRGNTTVKKVIHR